MSALRKPLYFHEIDSWRCSSATTLIMNRFKFGGQKLSKCLDMIRQSGGHARSSVALLGFPEEYAVE